MALLEATTATRYQFAGTQLQLLLVFAIGITVVFGFEEGMSWAFVGGLMADFLSLRPLGSTIFGLLMVVAATDLATPILSRARYPGCIAAALALTPMYLILADVATALIRPPAPTLQFTNLVIAGIVNALAAAVVTPFLIGIKRRAEQRERVLWWR
jgi:rod shape-determining protein MreD